MYCSAFCMMTDSCFLSRRGPAGFRAVSLFSSRALPSPVCSVQCLEILYRSNLSLAAMQQPDSDDPLRRSGLNAQARGVSCSKCTTRAPVHLLNPSTHVVQFRSPSRTRLERLKPLPSPQQQLMSLHFRRSSTALTTFRTKISSPSLWDANR